MSRQKNRGLPPSRPVRPLICSVAQRQRQFPRAGKRLHITVTEFLIPAALLAASTQKRSKYMSNLIFPLLPPAVPPSHPLSQSCGALAVQPCLAPLPDVPPPPTPSHPPPPHVTLSPPPPPLPPPHASGKVPNLAA